MISTPLVNLQSAMQQRPDSGSATIVVLFELQGESARYPANASTITGRPNTIAKGLWAHQFTLDQLRQSGRCKRNLAPI